MRKLLSLLIIITMLAGFVPPAFAIAIPELDAAINSAAAYILNTVRNPQVDPVGGEWAVIGLARSGYDVPDSYYENYYRTVEKHVRDLGGVLHDRKYSEYSRVILGLTAAGFDPRDVAGYDLTVPLGDFESTIWQGINGAVFALIALDSLDYEIPINTDAETQATRELYIAEILRRQLSDGGWSLAGASGAMSQNERSDPDITGMALQALAKYQHKPEVKTATEKALSLLSSLQNTNGGYSSWGGENIESSVQVLVALCELGIPYNDARFVKNGKTLVDNILSYKNDDGSFRHTQGGGGNSQMSTEQAFYALVAVQRMANGQNSLYRMSDAPKRGGFTTPPAGQGLPGKHPDVNAMPVINPGKTFEDVQNHPNQPAIEALAARGIINGKTETVFDPDATMTRAEFAAIVTRGMFGNGQWTIDNGQFLDVARSDWFYEAVYCAYEYGIVRGVSDTRFNPHGIITRQEAAVMVARAARLCGMDTARAEAEIRDTLSKFGDYRSVAGWAQESMAFCYDAGILDDVEFDIEPGKAIRRCEVAEMLHRALSLAELILMHNA